MPARLTFSRAQRLTHDLEYQAVYGARTKKVQGPLTMFAIPNERPHPRLGLAIGRRAGGAVVRNGLKRRLREAFRHIQHGLPRTESGSYDYVINAREHDPLPVSDYASMISAMAAQLHRAWSKQ